MKNFRSILLGLTVLLLASAAHAQSTSVRAHVPFDFVVADRTYPAGDYDVKSINDDGMALLIRNRNTDAPASGISLSSRCSSIQPSDTTKLVFTRMGGQLFLYQIWVQGSEVGREVPKSRTEMQLASNHAHRDVVIVAANILR